MKPVYLDYNGSTPLDSRVADAMIPVLAEQFGNASAVHDFGRRQALAVEDARASVAALVGGRAGDVIFTSGATEANNLAIRGVVEAAPFDRQRILVSAVEHASVSNTAHWISEAGLAKVDVIPVTRGGFVDPDVVDEMIDAGVLLVSVMAANSETGVINRIEDISDRVHSVGALLHCDATQLVGRLPFDLGDVGADLVSISGHKLYGPGGVGALIGTRESLNHLRPVIHGGGQERGYRSGSLNVAGIVGLGAAARIALTERELEAQQVARLRDKLEADLASRVPNVCLNGDTSRRLPNTANVRFMGVDADAVVNQLAPVAVSTGSACSSRSIEPSRVLLAMGLTRDEAFASIRFSLGRFTTTEEIDAAVEKTVTAVGYVRDVAGSMTG